MTTELATTKPSLIQRLSGAVGLDPAKYYTAVKTTCGCDGATDEHFAMLLMVADRYSLNPVLKQLYLMPTKKGVQVVIPVDGWVPLLTNHAGYVAHETVLIWEGEPYKSKVTAAKTRIWTEQRQALGLGPFEHDELMEECWRDTGPWKSHPTRMLGHKSVIQATRRCFGIYIMDADEASSIGEARGVQPSNKIAALPAEIDDAEVIEPEEFIDPDEVPFK